MIVISYCFSWKVSTFRGYGVLCRNLKVTLLESLQVVNTPRAIHFKCRSSLYNI